MPAVTDAPRSGWIRWAGIVAMIFGVATIFSGGTALFGPSGAREMLGAIVPFVLWFNFLSGVLYVAAGYGLMRERMWAVPLSILLAGTISLVLAAFALHVAGGGAYEMRTVGALILRASFWIAVAILARKSLKPCC